MPFNNIPEEMRQFPNWIFWKYEYKENEKPVKLPINPHNGHLASASNPATWSTYDHCVSILSNVPVDGIGFVISEDCPYSCIDLDHTTDPEVLELHKRIAEAFPSFQEVSPSGLGLHIWLKGKTPSNCNRKKVEIYTSRHYMTVTGNVYRPGPIEDYNDKLQLLWAEITTPVTEVLNSTNVEQSQSDEEIIRIASNAANGEKFVDLFEGRWQNYYDDDPKKVSCNQADYSLVNIVAHYTKNHDQIARIFRSSALGKRAKAQRDDYLFNSNYGIVIKAFDRMPPPIDLDGLKNQLEIQLAEQQKFTACPPVIETQIVAVSDPVQSDNHIEDDPSNIYNPPAGLVGEIAQFIYSASPLPVPEISITAALGLMAGVCGRCYNVSGSGLNQYLLLLANTGSGKDFIGDGIDMLIDKVLNTVPAAIEFVGPGEIASPQALVKYMSKTSSSFVSVAGEFGLLLRQITSPRANNNEIGLRRLLLQLYGKSGQGKSFKPRIYSDSEKNTKIINNPAFSIIGEGTPEQFYEILTEEMIHSGLLPRFTIIEYTGIQVEFNENHRNAKPTANLIERFAQLCAYCLQLNNGNNSLNVEMDEEAAKMFKDFATSCRNSVNSSTNEIQRHLWTRGNLKALRLAALLSVGTNYIKPVINKEQAMWAIRLINYDIKNLLGRFESGEIGAPIAQNEQLNDIRKAFKKYLKSDWSDIEKYPGASAMSHHNKVVPHAFITAYCRSRISFKSDRMGPVSAIKTQIISLIESGIIVELGPADKEKNGMPKNGRSYMLNDTKWLKDKK